jgi:hypothetical protein
MRERGGGLNVTMNDRVEDVKRPEALWPCSFDDHLGR